VGNWTAEEEEKLKDAVRAHGGKNWKEIAALVTGRTKQQCQSRWHNNLFFNIDPTTARTGKWTEDENKKLREAVGAHGANNWEEIVALVPGRTQKQCRNRWYEASPCNIDPATERTGKWLADEDKKLKNAVRAYGGKNWNWKDVAALVPGRTQKTVS
jgi:myb proto-oncogene protein